MKLTRRQILGWFIPLAILGCFDVQDSTVHGPGSETMGLNGVAEYPNGRPAAYARVSVLPSTFFSDTIAKENSFREGFETYTDSTGIYHLPQLPSDSFSVEITDDSNQAAFVACRVTKGKPSWAPKARLLATGRLSGRIQRLRNFSSPIFVQVAGMDRFFQVKPDSEYFQMDHLPAYPHTIRLLSPDSALGSLLIKNVDVQSSQTRNMNPILMDVFSFEIYSLWKYSKTITIRTGILGANISHSLVGFPLLVKLDSSNFPFDSASRFGSDIRFMSAKGEHLPYEIESWDASGKQALLWVRLDSLKGANDTQYVRMFWGMPSAPNLSSGPEVFDTLDGFQGVWHMGESGLTPAQFHDATTLNNTFKPLIPNVVGTSPSPLFQSITFDGKQGLLFADRMARAPQSFTLSLWFQSTGTGKLMGFQSPSGPYDRHIWLEPDGSMHFGIYEADPPEASLAFERTLVSVPGYNDGKWHFVCASQDPKLGQFLYMDGQLVQSDTSVTYAENISGSWVMGGGSLGLWSPTLKDSHYLGKIDESRISHALHSADWIRFSFETQKTGSTVLRYERN